MLPLNDDNPTEHTPVVTITFIVACCLVFLYQSSLPPAPGEAFVYQYGAIPSVVFGHAMLPPEVATVPAFATMLTSMFLHGSWMHLIGNMLYLWVFGNNIEDIMGHARFILFYVVCGVLAALSHALTDPTSTVPMVGASGAISGILGAYLAAVSPRPGVAARSGGGHHVCAGRHRVGVLVRDAAAERRREYRFAGRRGGLLRAHRRIHCGDGSDRLVQTTGSALLHAWTYQVLALLAGGGKSPPAASRYATIKFFRRLPGHTRPLTHPAVHESFLPDRAADTAAAGNTSY
jgi:hypothetical protein